MVVETGQIYKSVVKPFFVDPMTMDHCKWIYSILNGEKEVDLRVHENPNFLLQKDYKFNEGDITTLYCLAIPRQKDLRSIRDLTSANLPLLRSIRDESLTAIETRFNVPRQKIASFFHYQPTFYHLHVHFVHIEKFISSRTDNVSLDSVIANIEMVSDFYQRTTLTYKLGAARPLFDILVKNNVLQPEPQDEEEAKVDESAATEGKEAAKPDSKQAEADESVVPEQKAGNEESKDGEPAAAE